MVYKLNNGLTCIINNKKSSYSFNILLLVKAGSRNEKNGKRGLAHYLEHMMFKGTERRKNSKAISNNIYSKGGDTNAFTGFDVTGYYIESSSIYFKETCDVLSDMYFNSKFVGMKKEKDVVISENNKDNSNPNGKLSNELMKCIYKGTEYYHGPGGLNKDIKKFSKSDVENFYKIYYQPHNCILSISGKLPKNYKKIIKHYFDKSYFSFRSIPIYKEINCFMLNQDKPNIKQIKIEMDEVKVKIAFPIFNMTDNRIYPTEVISTILGGNMSSRLFVILREKMGLVYSISSSIDVYSDNGVFYINFGTFPGKATLAINTVLKELKKLKTKKVSKKDLDNAVNFIIGTETIEMENNSAVAQSDAYDYMMTGKIISMEERKKKFKKVSINDIHIIANMIFDQNKINIIVGSQKKIKENFFAI